METPETIHEQIQQLEKAIEHDRKLSNRYFVLTMVTILLVIALAGYLLELSKNHI